MFLAGFQTFFTFTILIIPINGLFILPGNSSTNENNLFTTLLVKEAKVSDALIKWLAPDVTAVVAQYGYTISNYQITTDDGYIINLQRIVSGPKTPVKIGRQPILLGHGLLSSSDQYAILNSNRSAALFLTDSGYDVWMLNCRGNRYSKGHVNETSAPNNKNYWEFSMHELSIYDLKSSIDFILKSTYQETLVYLGHSMGSFLGFTLLSMLPEYNSKIKLFINWGPAVLFKYNTSFALSALQIIIPTLARIQNALHYYNVLPEFLLKILLGKFCTFPVVSKLCTVLIVSTIGDPQEYNQGDIGKFMQYYPSGSSNFVFDHYGQLINNDKDVFRSYDWGFAGNLKRYGQSMPIIYNLENVSTNISISYSKADTLAYIKDVHLLKSKLTNARIVEFREIPDKSFGHIDFATGKNAINLVFKPMLKLLKDYN